MKAAPWILIAVLGFGLAGNARAEEAPSAGEKAAVYLGYGCFNGALIGGLRGVFAEEFIRETAKGCIVGAAAGAAVGAVVESGVLASAPTPSEELLSQEDAE